MAATAHVYTRRELEQLWVQAGGNPRLKALMAAIALAESEGKAGAVNPKSGATGLWQIHPGGDRYKDPLTNARTAVAKLRTQGLGAWEAYTNGSYRKHLSGGSGGVAGALERGAIGAATNPLYVAGKAAELSHIPGVDAAGHVITGAGGAVVDAAGSVWHGVTGIPGAIEAAVHDVEVWTEHAALLGLAYVLLAAAALVFFVEGALRMNGTSLPEVAQSAALAKAGAA